MFDNGVLRRIFGLKREEKRGSGEVHNEEINDLYSSPNIVRVIKSRRMSWAGHVNCMEERRGVYRVLVGKDPGVEGRIILRRIFRKCDLGGVGWIELAQDRDV